MWALQINLSGNSSNLGHFTNWRIYEHYFRGDHYYYWLQCDYSFEWKSSLRWDKQRWKSSFSTHLYQLVSVHWTTHQRFFSLSMGMIRYFSLRKMANPFLGIVIIHFLLHLMIFSSLPSVGTSTRFRGILLNFDLTPVGGCQQDVKQDDEISFAFDAFNANSFLKLTGLPIVTLNFPIILTDRRTDW